MTYGSDGVRSRRTEDHFLEELRGGLLEGAEDEEYSGRNDDRLATPDVGDSSRHEATQEGTIESGDDDPGLLAEGQLSSAESRADREESTRGHSCVVATAHTCDERVSALRLGAKGTHVPEVHVGSES